MFQHYLITRYNLKKDGWNRDRKNKIVIDEEWHEKRFKLFRDYCLPSIVGQTTIKFEWLIFFEENSDVLPVLKLVKNHSFIRPIFVKGYEGFEKTLPSLLSKSLSPETEYIITTRIDNDDSIHKDHLKYIQEISFSNVGWKAVIQFPVGLSLELGDKARIGKFNHPLNQFISLLEKVSPGSEIIGVYYNQHNRWDQSFQIVSLPQQKMWLQINHDTNKYNHFVGAPEFTWALDGYRIKKIKFPFYYNIKVFNKWIRSSILGKFLKSAKKSLKISN